MDLNYESPQVWEIDLEEDGILCGSQFGTGDLIGDPNGLNDNDFNIF